MTAYARDHRLRAIDLKIDRSGGSAAVRKAIAEQPKTGDRWITADIGMDVLADPSMRRRQLDALQPERPVVLTGWTGHGALLNSAALQAMISAERVHGAGLDVMRAGERWPGINTRVVAAPRNCPRPDRCAR